MEVIFVSSGSGLLTFPDAQVFLRHLARLACLCAQSAHSDGFRNPLPHLRVLLHHHYHAQVTHWEVFFANVGMLVMSRLSRCIDLYLNVVCIVRGHIPLHPHAVTAPSDRKSVSSQSVRPSAMFCTPSHCIQGICVLQIYHPCVGFTAQCVVPASVRCTILCTII